MVESNFIDFDKPAVISGGVPAATNDRTVRSVREFCTTWSRAVKTICLYPPSNPLPDEFRGKFFDALTLLLEDHGSFVLQVSDSVFTTSGQSVYESAVSEENLAYLFFKDGIREVGFEIGVSRMETDRFLQIGRRPWRPSGRRLTSPTGYGKAFRTSSTTRSIELSKAPTSMRLATTSWQRRRTIYSSSSQKDRRSTGRGDSRGGGRTGQSILRRTTRRHLHVLKVFGDISAPTITEKSEITQLCRPESDDAAESLGLDILMEIVRLQMVDVRWKTRSRCWRNSLSRR
jgi:hypothetical protein